MPETSERVAVIGAGLAGCEAARILASCGIGVDLYEMKPGRRSPAHRSDDFAELVCSNSLRADSVTNAVGLLKEELRRLGSLVMESADLAKVPAGGALAVDREEFSGYITDRIKNDPLINVISEEVTSIPSDRITVIATGPLTDGALYDDIMRLTGNADLHFFDAAAPIVAADSIDMSKAFRQSRYGKGGDDYINCPMNEEEYKAFYNALITAQTAEFHGVDKINVFEGCMPIEVMAQRGEDTMRFGPLKPVGLTDPATGKEPYACLQLRQDDRASTMYNLVGFQTRLKFGEQKRVFGMIPGLENAEFLRYGVMHRNTYIDSPRLLNSDYSMREHPDIFFAGQITGVEGYIESAASGFLAGLNIALRIKGESEAAGMLDSKTVIGSMAHYVSDPAITRFVPMNANFGIVEPMPGRFKGKRAKQEKYAAVAERSLSRVDEFSDIMRSIIKN